LARKTPRYTSKNVHGISYGIPVYKSRVIKSFSLTMDNARYLEGVAKGEKSDVVNRALAYYRQGGRSQAQQIKVLSEKLQESYELYDLQVGGKDTKESQISIIYVLTYPFQLLMDRLRRRK